MARRVSSAEQYPDHHSHGFCLPSPELVLLNILCTQGFQQIDTGTGKHAELSSNDGFSVVAPIKVMVRLQYVAEMHPAGFC